MYIGGRRNIQVKMSKRNLMKITWRTQCVPKRLKYIVDLNLEKSKPTYTWLLLGGYSGHEEEVAAWQMVCIPRVWGEERMHKCFLCSQSGMS